MATAEDHEQIRSFGLEVAAIMAAVARSDDGRRGAAALTVALTDAVGIDYEPSWVPALDTLGRPDDSPLAHALHQLAPRLRWIPTRRATDGGADFALAPLNEMLELGSTTAGIMYVRAGCQYPLHQHPPQELYLTLSGHGRWRYGGNDDLRSVGPMKTIYNHPNDLHSAEAGDRAVVALYVLWAD